MANNKKNISKWLLRLSYMVVTAVVYYMLFSYFFDTPIEYELKKSSRRLEQTLASMNDRYDSLVTILDNLQKRDRSVYKVIFETEPLSTTSRASIRKANMAKLSELSNAALGRIFEQQLSTLHQGVYAQNNKIQDMELRFWDNQSKINTIPSIQPVDNPELTLLNASFGRSIQPFYKTIHHHNGVDYAVPEGTAVFATADGYIQQMQTRGSSSGLTLKLEHGNGLETTYSHLSRTFGEVGQRVSRGDVIAFSGNSGLSYAPHLHYEVHLNGQAVDPLNFFFLELDIHKSTQMREIASRGMQSFD